MNLLDSCRLGAASFKKSIRKNNSKRKHILNLKMCFLVELFFLIDFYTKPRPKFSVYAVLFYMIFHLWVLGNSPNSCLTWQFSHTYTVFVQNLSTFARKPK